jgi:hypothetical protein
MEEGLDSFWDFDPEKIYDTLVSVAELFLRIIIVNPPPFDDIILRLIIARRCELKVRILSP